MNDDKLPEDFGTKANDAYDEMVDAKLSALPGEWDYEGNETEGYEHEEHYY
jgi:hypothetical protein